MPLIVTPGRLAKLGEFYHQLGSMLAAGVTLTQTLEHIHQAPPALFVRRPVQRILAELGLDQKPVIPVFNKADITELKFPWPGSNPDSR